MKMVTGVGRGLVGNMVPLKNLAQGITLIRKIYMRVSVV